MLTLRGEHIYLRALEPKDLDFLYEIENDESVWEVSNTQTPYSKFVLKKYLKNSHKDIYQAKQLRLAICNNDQRTLGLIDLYDFDPKHRRAGVGIIISDTSDRNRGTGKAALQLLLHYAYDQLQLHQLFACISEDNAASIRLFQNIGFEQCGTQRDWIFSGGTFKDQLMFQKIRS